MSYVIRVTDWNLNGIPCPVEGQFLEWYNPRADARGGEQVMGFTKDPEKALRFPTAAQAFSKWKEPLVDTHNVPVQRLNGTGAERPLTAFSIEVVSYDSVKGETNDQAGADRGAGEGDPPEAGPDAG